MYLRKGNLKFVIEQNNPEKSLKISQFRKSVDDRRGGDYFGYDEDAIVGKDFRILLPEDIKEIFDENLDFAFDGNDLKDIVSHIITFKIKNAGGEVIDMNAFAERDISTEEKQQFNLILEKKYFLRDKVKSILQELSHTKNAIDEHTKLINHDVFVHTLDEIMDYLYEIKVESVLLILSVEGFSNIRKSDGKDKSDEIISKIAEVISSNFRARDVVSYLGLGKFAVAMLRTFDDEVVYPLKRLESNLKLADIFKYDISINARFERIDVGLKAADMIDLVKASQVKLTINKN
ncbi:MAG: diguanylate cyclase [Rickettsiales bacterium]|nr:diguanylate cyclase [Rickettsiales bacterium]